MARHLGDVEFSLPDFAARRALEAPWELRTPPVRRRFSFFDLMITWTPERWRRASQLLDAALQHAPRDRFAFLATACDDEALRTEVEAMLALETNACSLLDGRAIDIAAPLVSGAVPTADGETTIGRYRLVELIGRGGMGVVYLAERADGVYHQRVALKLLTRTSPDAFRRFQAERQILASLDHPGVARLLDGGTAPSTPSQPDGVPYLVMEHVEGEPITDYCERRELPIAARIDLMIDVASAVQHAHQKMVIHRDLKPSNIYVTEDGDGQPQVKLLDFGIAKMLDHAALAPSVDLVSTQTGLAMLTPAYAAPEQVAGRPCDATTDVYQLGVVLYELLTECLPFSFEGSSLSEITRIILDRDPTRPSANTRKTSRGTVPSGHAGWGDLDTIVLKAMRKESNRRYASVAAFREDLARFQQKQPIRARPSTATYRARKFVQRHRVGVGVAGLFAGLVVAFLLVLGQQRNEARIEAEKARRVSGYLTDLFQSNLPSVAQGDTVTAGMLLDRGQDRLAALGDEPKVQAQMALAIGQARLELGQLAQAESLLAFAASKNRAEYGADGRPTLLAQHELAHTWLKGGAYMKADSLYRHVLRARRRAGDDAQVAHVLNDLGNTAEQRSQYAEAEAYHREALAIRRRISGETSADVGASLNNVGRALHSLGALNRAERYYRDAVAINAKVYGSMHPETSITLRNLGDLLSVQERYAEADSVLRKVLRIDRAVMPKEHPRIAEDLNELGVLAGRRERYAEAEAYFREALSIQKRQLGPSHPRIALSYNNLAYVLDGMGQTDSVYAMRQRAVAVARESLGPNHVKMAAYVHNLGVSLYKLERISDAERRFRDALATFRSKLPADHRLLSHPLVELGKVCLRTGRAAEAEAHLREALAITRSAWSPEHPKTAEAESLLGHSLALQEEWEQAETLLRRSYRRLREDRGETHASTQRAKQYLEEFQAGPGSGRPRAPAHSL